MQIRVIGDNLRSVLVIALVGLSLEVVACGGSPVSGGPSPSPVEDCRGETETGPNAPSAGPSVKYETLTVDGKLRDYRLFQPPALDLTRAVPLVVVLHGSPGDAAQMEGIIHFDDEAAKAGFLAASPNGCSGLWSYTRGGSKVADEDFIDQVIRRLEAEFQIDKSRVYVVAASAGSPVAYRLACDFSNEIVAVASVAGTMRLKDDCQPARPVSILAMHGTADDSVPFDGGGPGQVSAINAVIQRWTELDGCMGDPGVTQTGIVTTSVWGRCNGEAVVRLDKVVGGHHTWFGSGLDSVPGEPDANAVIWSFFSSLQPRA